MNVAPSNKAAAKNFGRVMRDFGLISVAQSFKYFNFAANLLAVIFLRFFLSAKWFSRRSESYSINYWFIDDFEIATEHF